ncbi:MAG: FAD:protein FMN transferase [Paludibacter sp.]|jgi:thiamine biosynthesis lipoprotein|nr:FAD:protein FMN transferase [Paludibacter sp.]
MNKNLIFTSWIVLLMVSVVACRPKAVEHEYSRNSGNIYGTYYSIVYQHPEGKDLQKEIDEKFAEFDLSLSTFNPQSVISRINTNDPDVKVDNYFKDMYKQAVEVSKITGGAFDITVAPLVNAWGFGFGEQLRDSTPDVESLLKITGFTKVRLEGDKLIKNNPSIMLDASAIAKGQASDVIAHLLETHGCTNYMVEIGGEIACKGVNPKGTHWRIGIDKPVDDSTNENQELQVIVQISGVGLATSGNYRQFYFRDGKKYAHTINPRSGYPVDHQLLSATVITSTCMKADAYATAFMVLGKDSALKICEQDPDMECYLIYANEVGTTEVAYSNGFQKYIVE